MSTPLTDFYQTLRVLTDDEGALQRRSDALLQNGLRATLRLNRVPDYALTEDGLGVTPVVTDPNVFALICLHTARQWLLASTGGDGVRAYSYRRRAVGESWGSGKALLDRLEGDIYDRENATGFRSWQTFLDYFEGRVGLPESLRMLHVEVTAPWQTIRV